MLAVLVAVVSSLLLALLGIIVGAHPEFTRRHLTLIYASFAILAIAGVWASIFQARESARADKALSGSLHDISTLNQKALDATNEVARVTNLNSDLQRQLLSQSASIRNLATTAVTNITGGKSFPYVVPQDAINGSMTLAIHNQGDSILNGVTLQISRIADQPCNGQFVSQFQTFDAGTLFPGAPKLLAVSITPKLQETCFEKAVGPMDAYNIEITAQNGMVIETLQLRPSHEKDVGEYAYRFWVTKEDFKKDRFGHNYTQGRIVLNRKWTDDQFAENKGKVIKIVP